MLYKCNRVFVTVSHDFYQCLMKMWMKTNHVLYEVDLGPGHMGLRMGHFKRLSDFKSDAQIVTSGYGQFWWFAEKSKEIVMKLGRQPTTAHWSGWAFEAFNAFTKSRVGYTRFGTWHLHVLSYIAQFEPGGSISYIGVGSCTIRLWQRWGEMQECGVSNWRVIIEGTGLGFLLACGFMPISAMVPGPSSNCESDEGECKSVMFRVEELLSTADPERIWCFLSHNIKRDCKSTFGITTSTKPKNFSSQARWRKDGTVSVHL